MQGYGAIVGVFRQKRGFLPERVTQGLNPAERFGPCEFQLHESKPLGERFADPTQDLMLRLGGAEDRRPDIFLLKKVIGAWIVAEYGQGTHLQMVDVRPGP